MSFSIKEQTHLQSHRIMCVNCLIRTGDAWELHLQPSHCDKGLVFRSGTCIGWMMITMTFSPQTVRNSKFGLRYSLYTIIFLSYFQISYISIEARPSDSIRRLCNLIVCQQSFVLSLRVVYNFYYDTCKTLLCKTLL